jgi:CheY-like chemotaxis protein
MDRPRPTVLVAVASVDNRELVKNYLTKETGLKFYFAANGQETFDICKIRIFSLLLMDMEMPVMDGDTAATRSTAVKTCEKASCDSHESPSGNDRNQ